MVQHKLSQIYKQYHCSIISLFIVKYKTRYYKSKYFCITDHPLLTYLLSAGNHNLKLKCFFTLTYY